MARELRNETVRALDKMVERVARKAGYTGAGGATYKQIIQAKFEQKREKAGRKVRKHLYRFGFRKADTDFAEEIKTYLRDGLIDLMNDGYPEEEALKLTLEKFDEAELTENFNEFVDAFDGFGIDEYPEATEWYAENGPVIGLIYGGFMILGMAVGGLLGWILGHTWLDAVIALGAGLFVGLGIAMFTNAVVMLKDRKTRDSA